MEPKSGIVGDETETVRKNSAGEGEETSAKGEDKTRSAKREEAYKNMKKGPESGREDLAARVRHSWTKAVGIGDGKMKLAE